MTKTTAQAPIVENHLGLGAFECSECDERFLNYDGEEEQDESGEVWLIEKCPGCGVEFDRYPLFGEDAP